MGYENMVAFLIFPSKSQESQISASKASVNFVSDPKILGGHKIDLIRAKDLICFYFK